jgi:hypothetical protein
MKNFRMQEVKESSFGVYIWQLSDGRILGDPEGNVLNIPSEEYDLGKMKLLRDAAAHYGYPNGKPRFMAGARRVTDEEYEEQIDRTKRGLTPDVYDAGALMDELAYKEQHGNV